MRTRLNETVHSRCHQQLLCLHHLFTQKKKLEYNLIHSQRGKLKQKPIANNTNREKKRNVCIENVYSWELHFRLLFIARLIEAMMAQSLCIFIEEWISLFHHHRFHSNISLYYLQRDMCTARERDSYITCIFIVSCCCCCCCFLPHRFHYIHRHNAPANEDRDLRWAFFRRQRPFGNHKGEENFPNCKTKNWTKCNMKTRKE